MRRLLCWVRAHPYRCGALVLLAGLVGVNALAYTHAHAMTHFRPADPLGKREPPSTMDKVGALFTGIRLPRPTSDASPEAYGLPFEVHSLPGPAGQLEAWFLPHPQRHGLVLLFHGYACCKANLLPEARAFHDLGYACLLVDFRGSGGSAGDSTTIGYREADDVASAAEWARERWPHLPVVLFGQSMGAAAVVRAAGPLGVKAEAIVLECPFDRLLSAVAARLRARSIPPFPLAHLLVFWGGVQHGFDGFAHNPVEDAAGVRCPVLLMHGSADERVGVGEVQAIHAGLNGPSRLLSFEGLGHESYVARRPAEWKEGVRSFLADICREVPR